MGISVGYDHRDSISSATLEDGNDYRSALRSVTWSQSRSEQERRGCCKCCQCDAAGFKKESPIDHCVTSFETRATLAPAQLPWPAAADRLSGPGQPGL